MNLIWFRTDLRLADHPALHHTLDHAKAQSEPCLALFVLTPEQHALHGEAPQKLEFIKAHINDLMPRLERLNVPSLVVEVPTFEEVSEVLEGVVKKYPIKHCFYNRSHWVNELKRDAAVNAVLADAGVQCHQHTANHLLPPGTVRKADGTMYHVFTPYKRQYIQRLQESYQMPLPIPEVGTRNGIGSAAPMPVDFDFSEWPVGERAAMKMARVFLQQVNYANERDHPGIAGTSRLSPYLANGVISPRVCLAHALKHQGEAAFDSVWVSELIWREFYHDLMHEYPRLAKGQAFSAKATDVWQHRPEIFAAWQQGMTGFPIIDAGMRELKQTGWMHNRVRMLTASFLCKLCLIDWRLGESHFMTHLLDGDLASNNGGWQWSSGTGCDAAPYFRIFNPTTQSKRFDADGEYIKKFVPELAELPASQIHDPPNALRHQLDYPEPIIDYKSARLMALDWFKSQQAL